MLGIRASAREWGWAGGTDTRSPAAKETAAGEMHPETGIRIQTRPPAQPVDDTPAPAAHQSNGSNAPRVLTSPRCFERAVSEGSEKYDIVARFCC